MNFLVCLLLLFYSGPLSLSLSLYTYKSQKALIILVYVCIEQFFYLYNLFHKRKLLDKSPSSVSLKSNLRDLYYLYIHIYIYIYKEKRMNHDG